MAGFGDMCRLIVLAIVLATCRAQAPTVSPTVQRPESVNAPECVYTPPPDLCPTVLSVNTNRSTVGNDSMRFKTKFGFKGKLNTGIAEATLVIGPLPATLQVEKLRLTCQRRRECEAVPPCVTSDNKIIATVKMARQMELRVQFATKITDIYVTGELTTSCGETVALEWSKGNPVVIPDVPKQGPEPVGPPPVEANFPGENFPGENASPVEAPKPDAGA